ncbi:MULTISPECIES: alpha/beta fold hydrolase [Actinosynnema]|uniref:alpha/beta fold hydrolase n=1 Tax=Actinosynnema TaxID=40566 RepID=UPI0020A40CDE|nr:alpha/beta hydrolase [Actinosynnema pretiosum]
MHIVDRGSGTPLVLLHGFEVDHRDLLPLDPVIAGAGGWRRIYVDLPGMGRSPGDGVASARDVLRVVAGGLDDLLGGEPFAVLGSSFGGLLARHLAHDARERVLGLATLVGVVVSEHARRRVPPRTVLHEDPAVLAALGEAATDYAGQAVVQGHRSAQAFLDHTRPGLLAADRAAVTRIAADYGLGEPPERTSPEPFTAPALFLTGRQDDVVGYADAWATLEHYPRASFAVLDAAGHNALFERPGPATALVVDWLERVRAELTRAG